MSEKGSDSDATRPELRGEAAWKAHKDRIAARNDAVRKAGKQQREEREREAEAARRAREHRTDAELRRQFEQS
jgi:hypothetical protein